MIELRLELREDAFEEGQGPPALEERFGGRVLDRFGLVGFLGAELIQRDHLAASAFLGFGTDVFVPEEVLERTEKERPKTALLALGAREELAGQQPAEEFLREILRIGGGRPEASDVGVNRRPVGLAEASEGILAGVPFGCSGIEHHRPPGGGEDAAGVTGRVGKSWNHPEAPLGLRCRALPGQAP